MATTTITKFTTTLGMAWLVDDNRTYYSFDEVQLTQNANLATNGPNVMISLLYLFIILLLFLTLSYNITMLYGDRTSILHVGANQTLDITKSITDLQASVYTYAGSLTYTPDYIYVNDTTMIWRGDVIGAQHVTVQNTGLLYVNNTINITSLHITASSFVYPVCSI